MMFDQTVSSSLTWSSTRQHSRRSSSTIWTGSEPKLEFLSTSKTSSPVCATVLRQHHRMSPFRFFLTTLRAQSHHPKVPQSSVNGAEWVQQTMPSFRSQSTHLSPSKMQFVPEINGDPYFYRDMVFRADPDEDKLGLHIGVYRGKDGKPVVLQAAREAEKRVHAKMESKGYAATVGLPEFRSASARLMFGMDSPVIKEERIAILQTISGTGALSLGGTFLRKFMPEAGIYMSDPTWGNHHLIFNNVGTRLRKYRYFDSKTSGLDLEGMITDLLGAPDGSIVLLHACAHNPTGVDPTKEQWREICQTCQLKNHLVFFDLAYQGFATGSFEEDAFAPRLFAENGMEFLVAQSYSKNLGIYGERAGTLSFISHDSDVIEPVLSQFASLSTAAYATPPIHGARIVSEVLSDPKLFTQWEEELNELRRSIVAIRRNLYDHLVCLMPEHDWTPFLTQHGMFSFIGLTPSQEKHRIYVTPNGRITLASLSLKQTQFVAEALIDSFKIMQTNGLH